MASVEIEVKPVDNKVDIEVTNVLVSNDIKVDTVNSQSNDIIIDNTESSTIIEVVKQENITEIEVVRGGTIIGGGADNNSVTDYVSEFENDLYIYSGYILELTPTIKKYKEGVELFAQGVTNVTTDWDNRLNLTYI